MMLVFKHAVERLASPFDASNSAARENISTLKHLTDVFYRLFSQESFSLLIFKLLNMYL